MKKYTAILIAVIVVLLVVVVYFVRNYSGSSQSSTYKDALFSLDGESVKIDGSSGLTYFGNEVRSDLNGDGQKDFTVDTQSSFISCYP